MLRMLSQSVTTKRCKLGKWHSKQKEKRSHNQERPGQVPTNKRREQRVELKKMTQIGKEVECWKQTISLTFVKEINWQGWRCIILGASSRVCAWWARKMMTKNWKPNVLKKMVVKLERNQVNRIKEKKVRVQLVWVGKQMVLVLISSKRIVLSWLDVVMKLLREY